MLMHQAIVPLAVAGLALGACHIGLRGRVPLARGNTMPAGTGNDMIAYARMR